MAQVLTEGTRSGSGSTGKVGIAIIIGSTRPGRKGEAVAKWVYEIANQRL